MKKYILNITKNETRGAILEKNEVLNPPERIQDVASISQRITYRIVNKPSYWCEDDEYKIIEV